METFSDSKGGLGALVEAFDIDGTGVYCFHFTARASLVEGLFPSFSLSSPFQVHLPGLRYVGGGCSTWVLTHEWEYTIQKGLRRIS